MKYVLITGASTGIGYTSAKYLLEKTLFDKFKNYETVNSVLGASRRSTGRNTNTDKPNSIITKLGMLDDVRANHNTWNASQHSN